MLLERGQQQDVEHAVPRAGAGRMGVVPGALRRQPFQHVGPGIAVAGRDHGLCNAVQGSERQARVAPRRQHQRQPRGVRELVQHLVPQPARGPGLQAGAEVQQAVERAVAERGEQPGVVAGCVAHAHQRGVLVREPDQRLVVLGRRLDEARQARRGELRQREHAEVAHDLLQAMRMGVGFEALQGRCQARGRELVQPRLQQLVRPALPLGRFVRCRGRRQQLQQVRDPERQGRGVRGQDVDEFKHQRDRLVWGHAGPARHQRMG